MRLIMKSLIHIFLSIYDSNRALRLCYFHATTDIDIPPDNKVHGANIGPTWGLLAPDGRPMLAPGTLLSGPLCLQNVPFLDTTWHVSITKMWHRHQNIQFTIVNRGYCLAIWNWFYTNLTVKGNSQIIGDFFKLRQHGKLQWQVWS